MANLAPTGPGSQGAASAKPQSREAFKTAAALWILDLGVTPAEARRWAGDPQHPAASCLELVDAMEALAGAL
jgi:hypothetical protein